jgi:hypothetical protein
VRVSTKRLGGCLVLVILATGWFGRLLDRWARRSLDAISAEVRYEVDEACRAWDALAGGDLDEADTLAKALMAKVAENHPHHGSFHEHSAHLIIGHVCLRRGDGMAKCQGR